MYYEIMLLYPTQLIYGLARIRLFSYVFWSSVHRIGLFFARLDHALCVHYFL